MASLSNLYISQSYQSLAHLGTNSALVPGTMTQLQDGLGQSLNIFFDGTNISSSGNIYGANITGSTGGNNFVTTGSFNAYTQSTNIRLNNIESTTASLNISVSNINTYTASQDTKNLAIASYTASNDTKWNTLGGQTGSFVTESESGSFLITASVNLNTITFTKGNASTFSITVNTGSGGGGTTDISSLNAYTASQDTKNLAVGYSTSSLNSFTASNANTSLNSYTASNDTKWSNLATTTASFSSSVNQLNQYTASASSSIFNINAYTSSQDAKNLAVGYSTASLNSFTASNANTSLNTYTASQDTKNLAVGYSTASLNSYTSSQDTKNSTLANVTASLQGQLTNIGSQSGSWITESETASFARTNVNNNFSVNQTFTNITAVSASFQYVQTTYETSSVIYSSGSNQFGDAIDDVQTLIGLVRVSGSQEITGSLRVTGTLTASLQQGYSWVGNGSNVSVLVSTSSFGTPTDLSSLNAYTASQNTKNLEVGYSTASLNSFTASNANTSLNSYTASQDTKNSTLATYTASVDTKFNAVGYSTASLNTFTSSQNTINTNVSASSSLYETKFATIGGQSGSWGSVTSAGTVSSSAQILAYGIFATTASNSFAGNQTIQNGFELITPAIQASTSAGLIISSSGNLGIARLGAGGGQQAEFFGQITAVGQISSSNYAGFGNATTYSQSVDSRLDNLENTTGSYAVKNQTNVFTAIQSFSASLEITGSSPNIKSGSFSGSLITNLTDIYTDVAAVNQIVTITSASYAGLASGSLTNPNTLYIVSGSTAGGTDISSLNAFTASQDTKNLAVGYSTSSLNSFTASNANTSLNAYTASQDTKNSTLASYTGSNDTKWTTIANVTSSLIAATGSYAVKSSANSFTGSQSISGSLIVTGSAKGNVVALSISSNTASMDLNNANYFTLTLADTATTHITATNITAGTSATLVITTGTNSSASLAPILLQPSGSSYSATLGSAKKDVLSLVAVGTANAFVVSTKNMI
jgi:hypothetical protein